LRKAVRDTHNKWKSLQNEFASTVIAFGPAMRRLSDCCNRPIEFFDKSSGGRFAAGKIPIEGSLQFPARGFVELNFLVCH
jgi:hypothetical protein